MLSTPHTSDHDADTVRMSDTDNTAVTMSEEVTGGGQVNKRQGRQLPAVPSKIPVRRDQSLPSSGRSTPSHVTSPAPHVPPLKREASSPPGLLFTGAKPRPPLAPKPSLNIGARSATSSKIPVPATPAQHPTGRLKKWDSTSRLEAKTLKYAETIRHEQPSS